MIDFKPSDVTLTRMPLVGTMGRCEREIAAAMMVRVCQDLGDAWQSVSRQDVARVMRADLDGNREPFASILVCPFQRDDFWDLVDKGFARWTEREGGPVELTEKGFEAIRLHVRKDGAK